MTDKELESGFHLTQYTPYLTLTGDLLCLLYIFLKIQL